MKKIFIISGEASGDKIGALLIEALRKEAGSEEIIFAGIGGEKMTKAGIKSLFDIKEISLMGFFEILPHIFKLKRLIKYTQQEIIKFEPDIVITIDSPGFCLRVVTGIKNFIKGKLVHIVAPSVWAYKPERAKKFAKIYDLLLTLLPFEPEYFIKEGLDTKFVGHFAFEQEICADKEFFRKKYNIDNAKKLICLTPGSRMGEIKRHLPIFGETIQIISKKYDANFVFIAANMDAKNIINEYLSNNQITNAITVDEDRFEAYKASDIAIAKSGTNSLEIALHATPQIAAYKMNFLSWRYIKAVALIKYATLVNIIANKEIIPEFLQEKCQPEILAESVIKFLENKELITEQLDSTSKIISSLKSKEGKASAISAREILKIS